MTTLEQLLAKYNFVKRTNPPKTTISEIEKVAGFKLPDDYAIYLLNYLPFEGFIKEAYIRLTDIDELIADNEGYGIFEYLPETLTIGGNGSGEFIGIDHRDDDRIVLSPYIDLEDTYHITIGSSFTDFLMRMDEGKDWFDEKE